MAILDGDPWIRRFHHDADSRVTLVCFPYAGGSASWFHPLSAALRSSLQVVALQYPGRQDRHAERPRTTIAELADESFAALRPLLTRPVAFLGHSLGATVAFEVARRMRAELDAEPVTLFASGRRAPSRHREERTYRLDDVGLVAELAALGGTDPRILGEPGLLAMILPVLRADYQAAETYRLPPGPPLTCPIVVLTGDDDPVVTPDEAQAWSGHTTGAFELHTFPGDHFFPARHTAALTALLRDRLSSPA
ncbi:surfactin synthase thioesterase subunit [Catenuloplanes nepalensis]|uniref:Surfactin synthase thioesterase subunit n=1 Tax=Catenuloplanes nepalensis TaxID=587533 RepID=A0ABT9MRY6_9ACTN|nr:alpha/beta fold hydrolase [Catenuloplanes nepalensis]MDP9794204.1 surfactin synthase thioesterase subunit [Catenuloplanes nepalensis]